MKVLALVFLLYGVAAFAVWAGVGYVVFAVLRHFHIV